MLNVYILIFSFNKLLDSANILSSMALHFARCEITSQSSYLQGLCHFSY